MQKLFRDGYLFLPGHVPSKLVDSLVSELQSVDCFPKSSVTKPKSSPDICIDVSSNCLVGGKSSAPVCNISELESFRKIQQFVWDHCPFDFVQAEECHFFPSETEIRGKTKGGSTPPHADLFYYCRERPHLITNRLPEWEGTQHSGFHLPFFTLWISLSDHDPEKQMSRLHWFRRSHLSHPGFQFISSQKEIPCEKVEQLSQTCPKQFTRTFQKGDAVVFWWKTSHFASPHTDLAQHPRFSMDMRFTIRMKHEKRLRFLFREFFQSVLTQVSTKKWRQEHFSDAMFLGIALVFLLPPFFRDSFMGQSIIQQWDHVFNNACLEESKEDDPNEIIDVAREAALSWRTQWPNPAIQTKNNNQVILQEWDQFVKNNKTTSVHDAMVAVTLQCLIEGNGAVDRDQVFESCKTFILKKQMKVKMNKDNIYFIFHCLVSLTKWGQERLNPAYRDWLQANLLQEWHQNCWKTRQLEIEVMLELLGSFMIVGLKWTREMKIWFIEHRACSVIGKQVPSSNHYHALFLVLFNCLVSKNQQR